MVFFIAFFFSLNDVFRSYSTVLLFYMCFNFEKVAGKHHQIYEAYYKQLDPKGVGTIEAVVAAKFLKKSGLSDVVLSRVSRYFRMVFDRIC